MNNARVFFRDDDLGWSRESFSRLTALFAEHGEKLNAAAIPTLFENDGRLHGHIAQGSKIQLVAHGYAHFPHQEIPKKSEYPKSRPAVEVARELHRANEILSDRFGSLYFPAFVPPWNRIDESFIPLLKDAGFKLLSRSGTASSAEFPELNMNLDLHTLKTGPRRGLEEIARSIKATLASGEDSVIMLHHGRMENEDFKVLDRVLGFLKQAQVETAFFSEWREGRSP